jgi:hypothetical protein
MQLSTKVLPKTLSAFIEPDYTCCFSTTAEPVVPVFFPDWERMAGVRND